jgi:hypothetical protein
MEEIERGAINNKVKTGFLPLRRDRPIDFARKDGMIQDPVVRFEALKWHFPRERLVEHHSKRVDVAAGVVTFSPQFFRGNVFRRAVTWESFVNVSRRVPVLTDA